MLSNSEHEGKPTAKVPFDADALRVGLAPIADKNLFCTWALEENPGKPDKPKKVPFAKSGSRLYGSFSDPALHSKLMTLEQAIQSKEGAGHEGVGLVFSPGCGVIGLDLDDCFDVEGDKPRPKLQPIQRDAFAHFRKNSFIEVSQSGTGLHAIALGDGVTEKANGLVELFGNKNFLALTGARARGVAWPMSAESVVVVTEIVQQAQALLKGTTDHEVVKSGRASGRANGINDEVLSRVPETPDPERAASALSAIPSPSDYDEWRTLVWAFCGAGGDFATMLAHSWPGSEGDLQRIWDAYDANRRGGVGPGTLYKMALASGWQPPAKATTDAVEVERQEYKEQTEIASASKFSGLVKSLDMMAPVKKAHAFAIGTGGLGMFPLGAVTTLASPGGGMKTALAISLAVHLAAGKEVGGLPVAQGASLVIAGEDDDDETMRRGIATTLAQIGSDMHEQVQQRVHFAMASGVDIRLTAHQFGNTERTGIASSVIQVCKQIATASGVPVRMIVFDHMRLVMGGDANDSGAATELMRALAHVAKVTEAAVVLLTHTPKATVNPNHSGIFTAADAIGSGAFIDNARMGVLMTPLTGDERKTYALSADSAKRYVAFRIIKSNYSEVGRVLYFRKTPVEGWGTVVPEFVKLSTPIREYVPPPTNMDKVYAYLKSNSGRFTRTKFKTMTGKDGPLEMGTQAAVSALDALIESGTVVLRPPTPSEVTQYDLGRQAKEVLHAVTAG